MRDGDHPRVGADVDLALLAEVLRVVDHQLLGPADTALHEIRKAAGAVRNDGTFFENDDFEMRVHPPGPRGGAQASGYASDDHQWHGRLFPFILLVLNKAQDIEGLELAVGVEAVDGVLLVGEDLEDRSQLGHDQQLDAAPRKVEQLDHAGALAQGCRAHDERAQAGRIDVIDATQVEDQVFHAAGSKRGHFFTQGGSFRADRDAAFEIEEGDALVLFLLNVESHSWNRRSGRHFEADAHLHLFYS